MTHSRAVLVALFTALLLCLVACTRPSADAACAKFPDKAAPPAAASQSPPLIASATKASVEGTWLFRCCDGSSTWVGMLTVVEVQGALTGAWLTDGDSHGSYIEGRVDGAHVTLSRRWRTGAVLHEQHYELTLDESGQHLIGSFREPAFDAASHSVQMERGFVKEPRAITAAPTATPVLAPNGAEKGPERDPKRPCDCRLVCYCGGIPPGREHYEEQARCGDSCKCPVCPPIP